MTKPLGLAAWPITDAMAKDPTVSALKKALGKNAWDALVKRLGEAPVEYLGSGFTGSAFLLYSGKVVKFTGNAELEAADLLMNDYEGIRPDDSEGRPPKNEPHPNVIQVHDAFAILQKETEDRIFGVAVVVKDQVDEVFDQLQDPELYAAASRLIGSWEPPEAPEDMSRLEADCWKLEEWVRETGKLDLSPVEKALRQDLVAGIRYLRGFGLCPPDLLVMSNVGIKDGRAVFFDVMNQQPSRLTEEEVSVVWGLKGKGFWS